MKPFHSENRVILFAVLSALLFFPTACGEDDKATDPTPDAAATVAVGDADVSQSVPTEREALKAFLESKGYAGFKAEPAPHASSGPHGKVRTFVNDVLASSLAANAASHPRGAASVKELYSGDTIVGWAVLVKTQADSARGAGYFWYELLNGKVVIEGNGKSACTGCHSGGTDYVLTSFGS